MTFLDDTANQPEDTLPPDEASLVPYTPQARAAQPPDEAGLVPYTPPAAAPPNEADLVPYEPSGTSALGTAAREATLGAGGILAGVPAGMLAGAAVGGGIPGALVGAGVGLLAGAGGQKAEDWLLDKLGLREGTGFLSRQQQAAGEEEHPAAAWVGQQAPVLLAMNPLKSGVTLAERGAGAAVMGGTELGQDLLETPPEQWDATNIAMRVAGAGLVGAAAGGPRQWVNRLGGALAGPEAEAIAGGSRRQSNAVPEPSDETRAALAGTPGEQTNSAAGAGTSFAPPSVSPDAIGTEFHATVGDFGTDGRKPVEQSTAEQALDIAPSPKAGRLTPDVLSVEDLTGEGQNAQSAELGPDAAISRLVGGGAGGGELPAGAGIRAPAGEPVHPQAVPGVQPEAQPLERPELKAKAKDAPNSNEDNLIHEAMRRPMDIRPMPSGANSIVNGPIVIDPKVPPEYRRVVGVHEHVEEFAQRVMGLDYPAAHEAATQAEKEAARRLGVDWGQYSKWWTDNLPDIEKQRISDQERANLHIDPYEAIGHHAKEAAPDTAEGKPAGPAADEGLPTNEEFAKRAALEGGVRPVPPQQEEPVTAAVTFPEAGGKPAAKLAKHAKTTIGNMMNEGGYAAETAQKLVDAFNEGKLTTADLNSALKEYAVRKLSKTGEATGGARRGLPAAEPESGGKLLGRGERSTRKLGAIEAFKKAFEGLDKLPDDDKDLLKMMRERVNTATEANKGVSPMKAYPKMHATNENYPVRSMYQAMERAVNRPTPHNIAEFRARFLTSGNTTAEGLNLPGGKAGVDVEKVGAPAQEPVEREYAADELPDIAHEVDQTGKGGPYFDQQHELADYWNGLDQADRARVNDEMFGKAMDKMDEPANPGQLLAEMKEIVDKAQPTMQAMAREKMPKGPLDEASDRLMRGIAQQDTKFAEELNQMKAKAVPGSAADKAIDDQIKILQEQNGGGILTTARKIAADENGTLNVSKLLGWLNPNPNKNPMGINLDEAAKVYTNSLGHRSSEYHGAVANKALEIKHWADMAEKLLPDITLKDRVRIERAMYNRDTASLSPKEQEYVKLIQDHIMPLERRAYSQVRMYGRDLGLELPPEYRGFDKEYGHRMLKTDAPVRPIDPDNPYASQGRTLTEEISQTKDRTFGAIRYIGKRDPTTGVITPQGSGQRTVFTTPNNNTITIYQKAKGGGFAPVTKQNRGFKILEKGPGGAPDIISDGPVPMRPGTYVLHGDDAFIVDHTTPQEIKSRGITDDDGKPLDFHEDYLSNAAAGAYKMNALAETMKMIRELVNNNNFREFSTTSKSAAPEGWKQTLLPKFKTWPGAEVRANGKITHSLGKELYMHPRIAEQLDDFYKAGFHNYPLDVLAQLNEAALKTMFTVSPIVHPLNEGAQYFIGRGWRWFNPAATVRMAQAWKFAVKDVNWGANSNSTYQDNLRRLGAHTMLASSITHDMLPRLYERGGLDIKSNPKIWDPIFKAWGIKDAAPFLESWRKASNNLMWRLNDYIYTAAVKERELEGMPLPKAIQDTERMISNYQLPTRIGEAIFGAHGGRAISQIAQTAGLSNFGRYHFGLWQSFGKMAAPFINYKGSTHADRVQAAGEIMATALLGMVLYPAMNHAFQSLSGNKNVEVSPRGMLTIPYAAYNWATGEGDYTRLAQNVFMPNIALNTGASLLHNRDWKGDPIVPKFDVSQGQYGQAAAAIPRMVDYAATSLFPPLETVSGVFNQKGGESIGGRLARIAAPQLGIKIPSPGAVNYQANKYKHINEEQKRFRPGAGEQIIRGIGSGVGSLKKLLMGEE